MMSQQQQLETLVELLATGGINATWHDEDEVQAHWQVSYPDEPNVAELVDLLGASGIGAVHIDEEDGVDAHWEVSLPDEALAELAQHEPEAATSDEVVELKRELKRVQIDRDQWKKKARARR